MRLPLTMTPSSRAFTVIGLSFKPDLAVLITPPGVYVPDELVKRMENAEDAKEEGLKICLEIIDQLEDVDGVHGIHIMAVGWEDIVPIIVEKAGLLPRPIV